MKVVFASTPSQEQEICKLVRYIYSNIFPHYFSDKDINHFEHLKVLHTSAEHMKEIGTLKDAFQIMTSMQTVISILESPEPDEHYSELFNKNASNLQKYGLFFPFEFEQFTEAKSIKGPMLSIYTNADNELII